ncbi:hypothetical protein LEP1GSC047_0194 [Leptospira inadai serovar Lyme str. 10]|uniref:Uncharacterized protein n=2 Tax=Leptospira inadai serovar Lyme TaxID=293084 RepID=V6HG11_9LEPT|nr:hypothetical protein [Leptospira inadai]EQA38898.1 hypothetical protein LEP1GSC047_0194 [Leptospira inadai serovar Lyme str. 10]PNV72116.1 hypothetical protein BES34_020005 [Leptospira inadai serovar Lyme]
MKYTRYFENEVLRKRPELRLDWIEEAISNPDKREIQEDGRIRFWKWIDEVQKYLRVITLEDGETVHNGFFDRGFKK